MPLRFHRKPESIENGIKIRTGSLFINQPPDKTTRQLIARLFLHSRNEELHKFWRDTKSLGCALCQVRSISLTDTVPFCYEEHANCGTAFNAANFGLKEADVQGRVNWAIDNSYVIPSDDKTSIFYGDRISCEKDYLDLLKQAFLSPSHSNN